MKRIATIALSTLLACAALAAAQSLDSYWKESGKSFPAAGVFTRPQAWAPGQYVVLGNYSNGKRDSVSMSILVRQEAGGWVMESRSIDKKGAETVMQMLLAGFDQAMAAGDASKVDLRWIKTLDKDGKISVMEGPQLGLMKGLYKSAWERMVVGPATYSDGGAVQVPAGAFAGTSMVKAKTKVMGFSVETETWSHPAVPLSGMVKSRSTDGKSSSELLSFGFDGKARIP